MIFVIDANNLAGQLGILFKKDFDRELISIIKTYLENKKIRVFLVFDGRDNMGDKYVEGFLTIIYTPKDSFYKSADDKIIEIVKSLESKVKDEVKVITDDWEIINEVEKLAGNNSQIKILKASDFAVKLKNLFEDNDESDEAERGLSEDQMVDINKDLLKIWK